VQRLRFCLWGQSVGLVPNPSSGLQRRYDLALDQPDVRPNVERILLNIKTLLDDASQVDEKYRGQSETSQEHSTHISNSRGLDIFKAQFERFKGRVRKHQQNTSPWKVAQWAVHDAKKFEDIINRLEKFVDGLEAITKSLQSLTDLHTRLKEEVEDISDTRDLKLLRDASSSHRSSSHSLSDSSSRSFIKGIAESILEQQTLASGSTGHGTSFVTANADRSTIHNSLRSGYMGLPGAYPDSLESKSLHSSTQISNKERSSGNQAPDRLQRANEKVKGKNFGLSSTNDAIGDSLPELKATARENLQPLDVPQNQRLLRDLLIKSEPRKPLSFAAGDTNYGQNLSSIKMKDEESWLGHSGGLIVHAESSSSAAKRMFLELRDIRTSKVPFISAAPLGDSLEKVLASIEGPPETPYEGGIFWITVRLPRDPRNPPLLRFQTKIYHPNISPQGHICADYQQRWNPKDIDDSKNFWYCRRRGDITWSLGALLTALCGLLAAPDVDDPLVPDIAQTYVKDHEAYWQAAKTYTKRYALPQRPNESDLVFLEDLEETGASLYKPPPPKPKRADTISIQPSSNSEYDEPYPDSELRYKVSTLLNSQEHNIEVPRMLPIKASLSHPSEREVQFDDRIYPPPPPSPPRQIVQEKWNKPIPEEVRQLFFPIDADRPMNLEQPLEVLDPYAVLKVPHDATLDDILREYGRLFLQNHPDNVEDVEVKLLREQNLSKLQAACDLLTCKVWRKEYDSTVGHRTKILSLYRNSLVQFFFTSAPSTKVEPAGMSTTTLSSSHEEVLRKK
jgi:ubiquitin-protein ligase